MERKPSTIQDYRGHLRRHLEPHFGDRPIDRIDADQVTGYPKANRGEGLAAKTVQNHLNFLHGIFACPTTSSERSKGRSTCVRR